MILKNTNRHSTLHAVSGKLRQNKPIRFWSLIILICLFSSSGAFSLGAYLYRSGYIIETVRPAILRDIIYLPKRIHALFTKPDVERITIDVKHKDYMKLAYQREVALAQSVLFTSDDDYVNGKIRYKDKTYNISLRLKGDEPDHFSGDKWSFRIKIKGENTLFGMKRFSIQHPKTRNFIYEWLLHQALKREGLIYLRYKFVDVTLNGKDMGIYALEEHTDKQLIEHNERRDGPILKFNEALLWKELVHQVYHFEHAAANGNSAYNASEIEVYQTSKWMGDSLGSTYINKAASLLESFRRRNLKTSEVFDVKKLATYFAIMDLFGTANGTQWVNIRFYYNPISCRLEPIGRDGSALPLQRISAQNAAMARPGDLRDRFLYAQIFSDTLFFAQYCKELERISPSSYLDNFFSDINRELDDNLLILYSEYPYFLFSKDVIYQNQHYIRTVVNPVKGFHAYFKNSDKDKITIQLGNIQSLPVDVINASYRDSVFFPIVQRHLLPPFHDLQTVDYQDVDFKIPKTFVWADSLIKDVKIYYRILGTTVARWEPTMPSRDFCGKFVNNDWVRQQSNVLTFDFIFTNSANKEIFVKPGEWTIDRTMIIPMGYKVICGGGTRLNLINSSSIVSCSPLEFIGNEDSPLIIQSKDSTGQGLVVFNAEEVSVLDHIIFKNLSNPIHEGWELTGAVTFYESDVQISHCQFTENRSEDGLNVIRSEININNSLFSKTASDAFDGDFVKGILSNSSFVDCGNDGIDVSGSVIEIRNVYINGSGDKGLSNGENSEMTVNGGEIKNADIAVASKDISVINLSNVKISGGQIGLTAYQKKPEFGPGSINATHVNMNNVPLPYLVEERSQVSVDGKSIPPSRDNVKSILYGAEYGKASK